MSDLIDKQKHVITTAADILAAYNGNGDAKLADSLRGILQSLEARRTQPEATAPAQDLSAAILAIKLPDPQCYEYGGREPTAYSAKQMRDLLKAAAALASSANALGAGDRVDAEKWRYIVKDGKSLDGKFTLVMCQPDGSVKELHGAEYDSAISAAILQSQKGGQA